jgi:hypothetical protein
VQKLQSRAVAVDSYHCKSGLHIVNEVAVSWIDGLWYIVTGTATIPIAAQKTVSDVIQRRGPIEMSDRSIEMLGQSIEMMTRSIEMLGQSIEMTTRPIEMLGLVLPITAPTLLSLPIRDPAHAIRYIATVDSSKAPAGRAVAWLLHFKILPPNP